MRASLEKLVVGGMAVLTVVFSSGAAGAATRSGLSGSYITGTNIFGRTGLFFSDTAQAPKMGAGSLTGHLLYGTGDIDSIQIPLGFNYGIAENFEVSASLDYLSLDLDLPPGFGDDSVSGLNTLTVSVKDRGGSAARARRAGRAGEAWESVCQARSVSATLHACAMQPRGANGASPSKISPMDPTP